MTHGLAGATPQSIDARVQHALQLVAAGRRVEAIDVLRGTLAAAPAHMAARCLLAAMLHEHGESAAALAELDAAPAAATDRAPINETRATILLALGRAADAERAARAALAAEARRPRALLTLLLSLDAQQRTGEAIEAAESLLALQPQQAIARRILARSLLQAGRTAEALDAASAGDDATADVIAGDFAALSAQSELVLRQMLANRNPRSHDHALRVARLLHQRGRSSEALAWSERAHALRPEEAEPVEMRAVALLDRGEVEAGLAIYRGMSDYGATSAEAANRQLILMHYDPALGNAALFAAHLAWARDHIRPFGPPFTSPPDRDAQRPLRVAWLSPRFESGPVASFFTGLLDAFDKERFQHALVALRRSDDAATARLRALAGEWLALHDLDDASLLQRLRACAFDVVVDLAGHSFGNRLRVLAQRVAPIQLCWLDYFDTTGVAAIDGWISDNWLTPSDSTQRFSERVLRLPAGRFCYTPPAEPVEAERIGAGPAVFASFNRPAKFNDGVLDAWAEILRRVPDARLELGAMLFDDAEARGRTLARFAERGIAAHRIVLHGRRDYAELMQAYRRVDIALDPFPFSGCTTSCDALWMGVPVVTRSGETFVSRQSASLLQRLGRPEWVSGDSAGYVERAVALAGELSALRAQRGALRARTEGTLCDADAQARDFAALLRDLWREHCAAGRP